jgi:hypothetical protein
MDNQQGQQQLPPQQPQQIYQYGISRKERPEKRIVSKFM